MALREKDKHVPETVRQLVLESLKSRRFNTVSEVVRTLKVSGVSQENTLRTIQHLAREGKVILNLPSAPKDAIMAPVASVRQYLSSKLAVDLWMTILLVIVGIPAIFLIPPDLFPLVITRWIFGLSLLIPVPGFAFVRSLFPFERYIDRWERLALSLGIGIALAILVGFALNFTPWGINLLPAAIGVSLVALIAILIATYRRVKVLVVPKGST